MRRNLSIIFFGMCMSFFGYSQLMINEAHNGAGLPTGVLTGGYIELIVTGNPCELVDISKIIIDDNNGDFANCLTPEAISGTGIARGFIRFKDIELWKAIPSGTIIVLSEIGPNEIDYCDYLMRIDVTSSDYIEQGIDTPFASATNDACVNRDCLLNQGDPTYNVNGTFVAPQLPFSSAPFSGSQNGVANFNNGGDAIQIRKADGSYLHGLGYGLADTGSCPNASPLITGGPDELYFFTGDNFFFENTIDDDFKVVDNWGSGLSTGSPGIANSCENAEWIASMRGPLDEAFESGSLQCNASGPSYTVCIGSTQEISLGNGCTSDSYMWSVSNGNASIVGPTTGSSITLAGNTDGTSIVTASATMDNTALGYNNCNVENTAEIEIDVTISAGPTVTWDLEQISFCEQVCVDLPFTIVGGTAPYEIDFEGTTILECTILFSTITITADDGCNDYVYNGNTGVFRICLDGPDWGGLCIFPPYTDCIGDFSLPANLADFLPNGTGTMGITSITDATGCVGTYMGPDILVNYEGPVDPEITGLSTICEGQDVILDAGPGFMSYSWSDSGGSGQTASFNGSGTYMVTTTDSNGCEGSDSFTVTEQTAPDAGTDGSLGVCAGDTPSESELFGALGGSPDNVGTWTNVGLVYTYTVAGVSPCMDDVATVTVMEDVAVVPSFVQLGPYCEGDIPDVLPSTSTNGIMGSWNVGSINTSTQNTTAYIFTPDSGICASTQEMMVMVEEMITPSFATIPSQCASGTNPLLNTSMNGISGTWSPAFNPNTTTTYTFNPDTEQCASTNTLEVIITPEVVPAFAMISAQCAGETSPLLNTSTNNISGTWSPAFNPNTTTTYTFNPDAEQCASTTTLEVIITPEVVPAFAMIPPQCAGGTSPLQNESINSITGTWSPAFDPDATKTYTFTPDAGQCASVVMMTVVIDAELIPSFPMISSQCEGGTNPLPLSSSNGVDGMWSPAFNPNATTTYTFTPDADECASPVTMDVVIIQEFLPTFAMIPAQCAGGSNPLLNTSMNGFDGSWSPAFDADDTETYMFTPDAGQCASTVMLEVVIIQEVVPTFAMIPAQCAGGNNPLLNTSMNGVDGSWSPTFDADNTTTYTFNPDANECATTTTLEVAIDVAVTPTFAPISSQCAGGTDPLESTSMNNISGSWTPAFDPDNTTTYTFTPDSGECATTTTLEVAIDAAVTPTFAPISSQCAGGTDPLESTSMNNISGSWSPAFDPYNTTTYTFTPDAGECATTTTLEVAIDAAVTPTFAPISSQCAGGTDPLESTSMNNINGSWSPIFDADNTMTYIFTPDAGECATTTTLEVVIDAAVTPIFATISSQCAGGTDPLESTSMNNISGSWSPAFDPYNTTTYTFTPDAGECATTTTLEVAIDAAVTPTFAPISSQCAGGTDPLESTSMNNINGSWSPIFDADNTMTYIFTPDAGECATTTTLEVVIDAAVTPIFATISSQCAGGTDPLESTSMNNISGSWSPAFDPDNTTTYTFTPDAGECATTTTLEVAIDAAVTPTFALLGPYCLDDVPDDLLTNSNNAINGTWNPTSITTSTVGNTTYTFTPDIDECAENFTMSIEVEDCGCSDPPFVSINPVSTICEIDDIQLTAVLSGTANSISWSTAGDGVFSTPDMLITDYTPGTTDIASGILSLVATTDDPDGSGPCSPASADVIVTIDILEDLSFEALGPYCINDVPDLLELTSLNGISGTWDPAQINTATDGTFNYTFTPDADQCANSFVMPITIDLETLPLFDPIALQCAGGTNPLMTTSTNMINGSWTPAFDPYNTMTYTFTPDPEFCASTATLKVNVEANVVPTFDQLGPYCVDDVADALAMMSLNGITGTWNPASINTTTIGNADYLFTPDVGQCAETFTMTVETENCGCADPAIVSIDAILPICETETLDLTAVIGGSATTIMWTTAGDGTFSDASTLMTVYTPGITDITNGTVELSIATDDPDGTGPCTSVEDMVTLTVESEELPTFDQLGPYCVDDVADALAMMSLNGITGTWNPASINTTTIGNADYLFTPDVGQCAETFTMTVETENCGCADPAIVSIDAILPICETETLDLTAVIGGSATTIMWTTAGDGSFSDVGALMTVYTPGAADITNGTVELSIATDDPDGTGPCTSVEDMVTLTIESEELPTFDQLGPYCVDALADALEPTSTNGIAGTWVPASINTSIAGTVDYLFTPDDDLCASEFTMSIITEECGCVDPAMISIDEIMPICENESINLTAVLSGSAAQITWSSGGDGIFSDLNGINTTYTPGVNDIAGNTALITATTDDPDALGPCSAAAENITLEINSLLTPSFDQLGPFCIDEMGVDLPTTSLEGYSGNWDGSINTSVEGITIFTFTPDDNCINQQTMSISVTELIIAMFMQLGPYCVNEIPDILPMTSQNGVTGQWDNAINTDALGSTVYTFTPDSQCAQEQTMEVVVANASSVQAVLSSTTSTDLCPDECLTVTFDVMGGNGGPYNLTFEISAGSFSFPFTLPLNSFTGMLEICSTTDFLPSIDFATPTLFIPDFLIGLELTLELTGVTESGCAGSVAGSNPILINFINPIVPTFEQLGPYCQDAIPAILPTTSDNGVDGTWNGPIDTSVPGIETYTFVSTQACTEDATMDIEILTPDIVMFNLTDEYCQDAIPDNLPSSSDNGITGTWSPSAIDTSSPGIADYTFTPDGCAEEFVLEVEIIPVLTPMFDELGPYCNTDLDSYSLPGTSLNGISGSWTPSDLFSPDDLNVGPNVYAFTPDTDCDETFFMEIMIDDCSSDCSIDLGTCGINMGNPNCGSGDLSGLGLIGSDTQGPSGSNQCIDITVDNFIDVQSMELNFVFDATLINNITAQNFCEDIAGFGVSNTFFIGDDMGNDTLRLVWFDFDVDMPATLPDDKVLLELCFDLVGANGSFAEIEILNFEVGDSNQNIMVNYTDCGSILICDPVIEYIVECNDNGTLDLSADDYISFQLDPDGVDLGSGYTVMSSSGTITPSIASYGMSTSFQLEPGTANGADITITVVDNDDISCFASIILSAPPCSLDPTCMVTASVGSITCDDNNTPCNPDDDLFSYELEIIGTGASGWTANDPLSTTGDYTTSTFTFGPYPSTGGDFNFMIRDNDDLACMASVALIAETCSEETLTVINLGDDCDGNGTADTTDDFYFVDIQVNGSAGLGTTWTSDEPNFPTGTYGDLISFGPYQIADGSVLINFQDASGSCTEDLLIEPPLPCSSLCSLDPTVGNILCSDNGTPLDASDDTFSFLLNVLGSNAGLSWSIDGEATDYLYMTNVQIGPYPLGDGSPQMFTLVDIDDPTCTVDIMVNPDVCVVLECSLEAELINISCDANDTFDDPSDDLFSYQILVTPTNPVGNGWFSSGFQNGDYNLPITFGPLPISANTDFTLSIFDNDDPSCTVDLFIDVPDPCSVDCATEPMTGTGMDTIFCGSTAMFDLFELMTGADIGGEWSLDGNPITSNMLDLGTLLPEVYTVAYKVNDGTPCEDAESMEITIRELIVLDDLMLTDCAAVTLPAIAGDNLTGNEAYYDAPLGMGNMLNVGDIITSSMTIYSYDEFMDCADGGTITITITPPSIDPVGPIERCNMYELPVITGQLNIPAGYFTGAGGTGTPYSAGDIITTDIDLFMYYEDGNCIAEEMLSITIMEEVTFTLDTAICPDDEIDVNGTIYNQSNPSGQETLITAMGCDSVVTIALQLLMDQNNAIDTFYCAGDMLMIGGQVFDENNMSGTVILDNAASTGCDSIIMVQLTLAQDAMGTLDTLLCPEDVLEIGGMIFDAMNPTGEFTLPNAASNGCDSIVMVFAEFELPNVQFEIVPTTGISQQINIITDTAPATIVWDPMTDLSCTDCLDPIFDGMTDQIYTVTLTYGSGCEQILTIPVETLFEVAFYLPNIFSPNGDGMNEVFFVQGIDEIGAIDIFQVYDRWGNLIHSAENVFINDKTAGWDGRFKDKFVVPGVYTYYVIITDNGGNEYKLSGNVTLIN